MDEMFDKINDYYLFIVYFSRYSVRMHNINFLCRFICSIMLKYILVCFQCRNEQHLG